VPAGMAGIETAVTVRLEDGFGNPVTAAGGQVAMTVSGANSGAAVRIDDAGAGSYLARYTPTTAGSDQLDLRVAGQPIPGSPFTSSVAPGPADPDHTTAEVPSEGRFAQPIDMVVEAADAFGNPLGHGGDVVMVTPEGSSPITASDQGDGTYRATWQPFTLGLVNVTITINGNGIHNSPFPVHIRFF
jgi:Filamin/ABP280 repeat